MLTKKLALAVGLSLAALVVGLLAITAQSFWIDEGNSIFKAVMPTIPQMWGFAKTVRGSEIQMPLYMISLWGWEKIVPSTEYALRALNIPLFIVAVFALRKFRFWPLVLLCSPFAWYYLGELRPYMFQIAGGSLAFASLFKLIEPNEKGVSSNTGVHLLFFSCFFLAASSLTAAVWSIGFAIAALVARPDLLKSRSFWLKSLVWFPLASILGFYYFYTLSNGYRGTVARNGGLLTISFGIYELMGLVGLGPGRSEMRGLSILGLLQGYPWLPFVAMVFFATWTLGSWKLAKSLPKRAGFVLAIAVAIPMGVFLAVGIIANFNVLGRHLSPVLPAFLVPLAVAFEESIRNKKWFPLTATVILASVISCVMIRVSESHSRDNYRLATKYVIEDLKAGKSVAWQADMNSARFYAYRLGGTPYVHAIQRLESEVPSSLMFADVIYLNRPDIAYGKSDYRANFMREGFNLREEFAGFEVWDRGRSW